MDIKRIEAGKYNKALAQALKEVKEFKAPDWVSFVKSGTHSERTIAEEDFWYKRAASILRQVSIRGTVGVERLRTRYGGRKDRGTKPDEFRKAGGKIIRMILQQAEEAGFLEKSKGKKKGRQLTDKGKEFLDDVASKAGEKE
ncbi:30S ribosomal protein S19e [Candidatus Pacearchaeota archaeon CG_4_9_14_0_2_um_filter_39_13]|nr:30S ribosomal protein S19e [Candidatus Pacearchaeota archaeon]OIO43568.1 MAG: 30S ribosomal protein S19e [Candidatus Pacearchaeota archaeon CG1_02_39_14]PJC45133.1 MAG: 30S ribosomal protein S19e [Candidatus Pacearchaeota archaeon CG_4_9_14_0_2_um_filter_39_13]